MRVRDVLAGLGLAIGLLGLGFALAPGLGASVDLSVIPVQFVGFAAVGLAVLGYLARRRTTMSRADPPVVESASTRGRPGDDVDAALVAAGGFGLLGHTRREEVRDRIYSLAIEALVVTEGCSREGAAAMLKDGTWTDDPRALAMFSAEPPATPMGDVLAGIVTGRSQFVVQATHAIEAIRVILEDGSDAGAGSAVEQGDRSAGSTPTTPNHTPDMGADR